MTFFNVNVRGKVLVLLLVGLSEVSVEAFGGSYLGTLSVDKAYDR